MFPIYRAGLCTNTGFIFRMHTQNGQLAAKGRHLTININMVCNDLLGTLIPSNSVFKAFPPLNVLLHSWLRETPCNV